jgi:hypothetical protein
VRLLGVIGLRVTPLDPEQAARVLIAATRPDTATTPTTAAPITAPITAITAVQSAAGPSTPGAPRSPFLPPHANRPHGQLTPTQAASTRASSTRAASTRTAGPRLAAPPVEASAWPNPAPTTARSTAAHQAGVAVHDEPTIELNLPVPTPAPASRAGLTAGGDDEHIELANTTAVADDASRPAAEPETAAAMAAAITAALEPRPASGDHATDTDAAATRAAAHAGTGAVAGVAEDMTLAGDEGIDEDLDGDLTGGGESPETHAAVAEPSRPVGQTLGRAVRPTRGGGGSGRRRGSPARSALGRPGARERTTAAPGITGDRP